MKMNSDFKKPGEGMINEDEIVDKFVVPFYVNGLEKIVTTDFKLMRQIIEDFTQEIAQVLFDTKNWRHQTAACLFCGIKGWVNFEERAVALLSKETFHYVEQAATFSLACFSTERGALAIDNYLEKVRPITGNAELCNHLDWAVPALTWIDREINSNYARKYRLALDKRQEYWDECNNRVLATLKMQNHTEEICSKKVSLIDDYFGRMKYCKKFGRK